MRITLATRVKRYVSETTLTKSRGVFLALAIKRTADLAAAILGLLFLAPVMLIIAVAIKLDSRGPILFRQRRMGRGGRIFWILKFRTMVSNAENRLAGLESLSDSHDGVLFTMWQDPRVTRVGRFLRRSSLDELPQLINVLYGEMSLVGPRPLQPRDCERLEGLDPASFKRRLLVVPGLTGLAQVSGRRELPPRDILKLDQWYGA
jgi:lipopolysaccharide/colanic/teichoic acid biosynthesis glycosyltransferase